jgi:hypothetical protein
LCIMTSINILDVVTLLCRQTRSVMLTHPVENVRYFSLEYNTLCNCRFLAQHGADMIVIKKTAVPVTGNL